jgi:hypothetical protein
MKANLRNLIIVTILLIIGAGFGTAALLRSDRGTVKTASISPTPAPSEFSYPGVEGKTALDLLSSRAAIQIKGEGANAFVVAINGRVADDSKKEFWSFYVNGEQSQVGAGGYTTKSGDKILWKIETY